MLPAVERPVTAERYQSPQVRTSMSRLADASALAAPLHRELRQVRRTIARNETAEGGQRNEDRNQAGRGHQGHSDPPGRDRGRVTETSGPGRP